MNWTRARIRNSRRTALAVLCLLGAFNGWTGNASPEPILPHEPQRVTHDSILTLSTNPLPADVPEHLRRGFELAHLYCQACHLFPEPHYLTKDAWMNGALRLMALRLGAAKLNYDKHPDGPILKEAGAFPNEPLISEQDWFAICDYFKAAAPDKLLPQPFRPPIQRELKQFRAREIQTPLNEPWTTLVKIDPAHQRLFLGDAQARSLSMLDSAGHLVKSIPVESGPVSMVFKDGGAYLALIGHIFPSDQLDGKVVLLTQSGDNFSIRTLLDKLRRPTDVILADLNGDGREDLIVSEFGNILGRFSWFENLGNDQFEQHTLLDRPGTIRARLSKASAESLPDLFVLTAQAREGIYYFRNQGRGEFELGAVAEYPPVWGSTYFEWADFNHDGRPDLLVTNGDSGDYVSPPKPFHGIRIYLNDGENHFHEAFFYPLNGAFKAMAGDFDGNGELDIAAISFFPDYLKSPESTFVLLQNKGNLNFEASSPPESLHGRWLTMDVGDLDGDGDLDIVLGSFINGPASVPIPPALQASWKTNHVQALILENLRNQLTRSQ